MDKSINPREMFLDALDALRELNERLEKIKRELDEMSFKVHDHIIYSLKDIEGDVTHVSAEFVFIKVTYSNNPEINVGKEWGIHKQFQKHLKVVNDRHTLQPSDQKEADTLFMMLQRQARNFEIDLALRTGDKERFMKLTGDSQ